ncbi:MAG: hypothetical protein NTY90_03730 [Candidatus Micrarchaeota archaeon]|nr:hypothetical protein [Candidatus Micrarchaeota archaeon]
MRVKQPGQSRGRRRAFVFTTDAIASLVIVTVALAAVIALQQSNAVQPIALERLGRGYLEANYFAGTPLSAGEFKGLTGFNASESPIQGTVVARSVLFVYPSVLAGCNCSGASCEVAAGVNDSCLSAQENLGGSMKQAWVAP